MATKTKAKPKPKAEAAKLPHQKFNTTMRRRIFAAVKAADKAGTRRKDVFEKLAAEFQSEKGREYTLKQVSAQFHLHKKEFGYDVYRQAKNGEGKHRQKVAAKPKPKAKRKPKYKARTQPAAPKPRAEKAPTAGVKAIVSQLDAEVDRLLEDLGGEREAREAAEAKLKVIANALS